MAVRGLTPSKAIGQFWSLLLLIIMSGKKFSVVRVRHYSTMESGQPQQLQVGRIFDSWEELKRAIDDKVKPKSESDCHTEEKSQQVEA